MIGRTIKGKYKIYDQVGSGGFATVYLGRNMDTNEIVAIKVLSEQYTTEARYLERFQREARLAERLQHPNIVRILDHGVEMGLHFLVMEFVEGLTLAEVMERRGPLPVQETLSYIEQTCAGLEAAYRVGVVHRDVKPANLMITPDGKVKIMDFGIARVESMASLTQSGVFLGTPRYISPEMARGANTDIRSDLYSMGLLAYEMLVGTPAFDADNPWAILRQQIEGEPAPIRTNRADVPPWLEAIILRSMAKDPDQRFQTPTEMLAALQEQTATPSHVPDIVPVAVSAAAEPSPAPLRGRGVSRGLILVLAGAVGILIIGLVAFLVLGIGQAEATPTPAATVIAAQAHSDTPAPLPTMTALVIVVTSIPADTAVPTIVEPTPTAPSPEPTETQSPEPTSTPLPEPTETPLPEPTSTPSPQPSDTPEPTAPPTQVATDTPRPTDKPTSPPAPPVTGRIAFSAGGMLYVVDVATGQRAFSVPGMRQPDFRRDGTEIIANGEGGERSSLVNIDASTGAIIRNQTAFTNDFHPSYSPDGTRFVYDSLHHGLGNYWMLYTQGLTGSNPQDEVTLSYSDHQIRGISPVWMQDDWIAFTGCDYWPGGSGGSKCGIYRIPSWGERPSMLHPGGTDMRATDNHGAQLVYMSQETGNWEVYVIPNQGGAARNLSDSPGSQDGLGTFSPDGTMVAFLSNRGGSWAIWVLKLDGSGLTKLFDLPVAPTAPWYDDNMSWGP